SVPRFGTRQNTATSRNFRSSRSKTWKRPSERTICWSRTRRSRGTCLEYGFPVKRSLTCSISTVFRCSPAEGFGLVPLEAMSVGTAVVGLDSFGGRQYFRHMENCAVASYPNIEEVAAHLIMLCQQTKTAMAIAERGQETAGQYTYQRYSDAWTSYFTRTVGLLPISSY